MVFYNHFTPPGLTHKLLMIYDMHQGMKRAQRGGHFGMLEARISLVTRCHDQHFENL